LFLAHDDGFRFNQFLFGLAMLTSAVVMRTIFDVKSLFLFFQILIFFLLKLGINKWFYKRNHKFKITNGNDQCMFMWNMSSLAICITFSYNTN
jgi:hypothetical protein